MRLTAKTIHALRLPRGAADQVFFDGDLPGFGFRLRASGAKTWLVQYAIAGKTRRLTLGSSDVLDPGKAREAAKEALAKVRLGGDPANDKQTARAAAANTFGALLPVFLARQKAKLKPRSYLETERHLVGHARALHARSVSAIDRAVRLPLCSPRSAGSAARRLPIAPAPRCRRCSHGPPRKDCATSIR